MHHGDFVRIDAVVRYKKVFSVVAHRNHFVRCDQSVAFALCNPGVRPEVRAIEFRGMHVRDERLIVVARSVHTGFVRHPVMAVNDIRV